MFCKYCGKEAAEGYDVCPDCLAKNSNTNTNTNQNNVYTGEVINSSRKSIFCCF